MAMSFLDIFAIACLALLVLSTIAIIVVLGMLPGGSHVAGSIPTHRSTGEAAIFTSYVKVAHIIRRVMLRMTAILNYVVPF